MLKDIIFDFFTNALTVLRQKNIYAKVLNKIKLLQALEIKNDKKSRETFK